MTEKELDKFITVILLGAFPQWEMPLFQKEVWKRNLEPYEYKDASIAMKAYYENSRFRNNPSWEAFNLHLQKVLAEKKTNAIKSNRHTLYIILQCVKSYKTAEIGKILREPMSFKRLLEIDSEAALDAEKDIVVGEEYAPEEHRRNSKGFRLISYYADRMAQNTSVKQGGLYLPHYDRRTFAYTRENLAQKYFKDNGIEITDKVGDIEYNLYEITPPIEEVKKINKADFMYFRQVGYAKYMAMKQEGDLANAIAPTIEKLCQTLPDTPLEDKNATEAKFGAFTGNQEFDDIPF